ncbi:hypothetical protein CRE_30766 [Caenorhabditis remanei]|uniref:Uncharacterized protein n=1 Tax=Caenorhabditis remanei TaxID=31234 RepID=E3LU57_CAERE|nr:hypothetical protein CRE_30766 [Caenorhabditis remanei]
MTDEGQVPATGSFSMELMRQFKDEFLEMIAPELLAMRKGDEKVPELSQKGLQKQAEINVQVINMLNNGAADLGKAVEEVVGLLKRRNQELMLLDKDPSALKNVEKLRAIAAVTSGEGSSAGDAQLMALAQLMGQGDTRSQRGSARRQWFPAAGFGGRQSGVRNFSAYSQRGGERAFGTKRPFSGSSTSGDFPKRKVYPNRLSEHIQFWCELTGERWILEVIKNGYEIPLDKHFPLPAPEGMRKMAKNNMNFVITEINKLRETGVVSVAESPMVVSPLQVARNGEKLRLILDLSKLNKGLSPARFRQEDWKTVWPFLSEACYAATFDFRSGYHHIKISEASSDLLAFSLSDPPSSPFLKFNALPFGLSTAPWLFTKIFRPLVGRWRAAGINIFLYLDDGLILAKTREEAERAVRMVREDLKAAGVCVAEDKSNWVPSAQFTWLGIRGDLSERTVRLTGKRENSLRDQISLLKRSRAPSVLDRQKMCGYLSSLTIVAGHEAIGRQRQMASVVAEETDGLERAGSIRRQLSEGEISELDFWKEKLESGGMIRGMEEEFEPQWFLFTDASAEGLGAVLKNGSGQTVMRMSELGGTGFQNESSALRELRAVLMAVERMASWKRGAVLIHTDSQAAVIILRKGSMKRALQSVAERVWESLRSIGQAKYIWIPREQNKEADEASRDFDYDDWAVQNWAFEWAQKRWGEVKCDWFADEQNTKTELFFSRLPEPGTLGADVFENVDKAGSIGLAWWVPPPVLIPRLMRVARQKKLRGILATPLWKTHPSYQALVNERGEFIPEIRDSRIFKVNTKIISPGRGSQRGERMASEFCRSPFMLAFIDFSF